MSILEKFVSDPDLFKSSEPRIGYQKGLKQRQLGALGLAMFLQWVPTTELKMTEGKTV